MPAGLMIFAGFLVSATLSSVRADEDAPKYANLVNQVEGKTFIISIRSDGSLVKKGDVVCELESAALRDKLTNQEIALIQSKAVVEAARRALEVAQVSAEESAAGIVQEISMTAADIRIAEIDIKIAKEKLETAKVKQKTLGERGDYDKAVTELATAEAALNTGQARLKALKGLTQQRRKAESDLSVSKAQTDLKSSEAIYVLETAKFDKTKKMIDSCVMKAPFDGRIEYANPRVPRADGYQIEEGAAVRLRQVILRIVPE